MPRFPLRIGTDIADIRRWDVVKDSMRVNQIMRKILHDAERTDPREKQIPLIVAYFYYHAPRHEGDIVSPSFRAWLGQNEKRLASHFAGRWAAKEAAKKAWGPALVSWKDIQIIRNDSRDVSQAGLYVRCLPGSLLKEDGTFDTDLYQEGALSISHDGDYATATVIAEPLEPKLLAHFKERAAEFAAKSNAQAAKSLVNTLATSTSKGSHGTHSSINRTESLLAQNENGAVTEHDTLRKKKSVVGRTPHVTIRNVEQSDIKISRIPSKMISKYTYNRPAQITRGRSEG